MPLRFEALHAVRSVRKGRGLTFAVVMVLGLGIGAVATAFSFLDAAFLRPLPYPQAERLVALNQTWDDRITYGTIEARTLKALQQVDLESFTGLEGYRRASVRLTANEESIHLPAALVTPGLLRLIGVDPILGTLDVGGDGVLLSGALWEDRFGSDRSVVGETIQLSGRAYRIVGVMPVNFAFPGFERLWIVDPSLGSAGDGSLQGVARLAPDVPTSAARSELSRHAPQLAESLKMDRIHIEVQDEVIERDRGALQVLAWLLFSAGAVLLLLVTSNVASLILVWNIRRRGEIAVRTAMGAGRGRLLVRSLLESIILAFAGGALGLFLAYAGMELLIAEIGGNFPPWLALRVDGRILIFTATVALGSVLVFGLLPSLRATNVPLAEVLRGTARSLTPDRKEHRLRSRFVAFQVALSTLLVSSSVLLLNTADNLSAVEPGYAADEVLSLGLAPPEDVGANRFELSNRVQQISAMIDEVPDTRTVSYEGAIGGLRTGQMVGDSVRPLDQRIFLEGKRVAQRLNAPSSTRVIGSNYLELLDLELLDGRSFGNYDLPVSPLVALVPASVAKLLWPDEPAVGQNLTIGADGPGFEVIGVIEDRKQVLSGRNGIRVATIQDIYLSASQALVKDASILVRSEARPMELASAIDHRVADMGYANAITEVSTLGEEFRLTSTTTGLMGKIFGAVALASILVCVVGLVGLISQLVAERRREIGIRLAIGAEPQSVVRMIARQGIRLAAVGTGIGLILSAVLSPLLGIFVFGASVWNPAHVAIVLLSVLGVAGTASLVPALRAIKVHPSDALKGD